jgi:hypothetical protein
MATTNNITGDKIASKATNKQFRDGWDNIFGKKTAEEWLKHPDFAHVYFIIDPDGWRENDGVTLETPISRKDFERRLSVSTIYTKNIKK